MSRMCIRCVLTGLTLRLRARDLGHRLAVAEESEDFELTIGEPLVRQRAGRIGSDLRRQPLRHRRAEPLAAAGDAAHGGQQQFRRSRFLDVTRGAGAHGADRANVLGVHAHHQHGQTRERGPDLLEHFDAVALAETGSELTIRSTDEGTTLLVMLPAASQ